MRNTIIRRRRGFSLIELLIVVAIIAALVGVAVPFFQDNLSEAQRTKAGQDLEVIKKAISLFDAREARPLVGTDLSPLLGRYMQELPRDPWGNDYLFDGAAGVLASYGADALPEGAGGDTDIVVYTRPPLMLNRVQYQGSWGKPSAPYTGPPATPVADTTAPNTKGNKFIISLTKPVVLSGAGNAWINAIELVRNVGAPVGSEAPLKLSDTTAWTGVTWVSGASAGGNRPTTDKLHRPELGVVIVRAEQINSNNSAAQSITPTMALDFFYNSAVTPPGPPTAEIEESFYLDQDPVSPLDTAVFGTAAATLYRRPAQALELVSGTRRGVKLEKY